MISGARAHDSATTPAAKSNKSSTFSATKAFRPRSGTLVASSGSGTRLMIVSDWRRSASHSADAARLHVPVLLKLTLVAMTKDIVGKLKTHLSKRIEDEAGVVYLLVEVRKLLERDDPNHNQGALWMYCHWALHVDLDSPKTTMDFLSRVDCWITNTVAYLTPAGPWQVIDEHRLSQDFIFLNTFRSQLRDFLSHYGLPIDVCDTDELWHDFLEAYSGVIEDGSLSVKADKLNVLSAVKQVIFRKGQSLTDAHHVPFVIRWDIELKDGRTVKASLETVPHRGGSMTAHLLEVVNNSFVPPPG